MNFIVDKSMSNTIKYKLEKYGSIYESKKINVDDQAIAMHPDLQIHFVNDNTAFCPPDTYEYYRMILPHNINIYKGYKGLGSCYPDVSSYNVARVGNHVFCNTKITDKKILDYYLLNNFKIVHINQGFSKCNISPLTDSAFFTEDRGIYRKSLECESIECILLETGTVSLNGFDHGFIGGATGLFDKKFIVCGYLRNNINKTRIYNAAESNSIEVIELSDEPLYDYGSIISFNG